MSRYIAVVTVVLLLLVSFGFSQSSFGFKGIGGHLSMNDPSISGDVDPGFGFGLGVNANLGEIIPGLFLIPEINYWSTSKSVEGIEYKLKDFQINANVDYYLNKVFEGPFVGGGLGINMATAEVTVPGIDVPGYGTIGGGSYSDSETKIGINLEGGWRQPFSPTMTGFAMVRYSIISDMNTLSILAGVTMNIGGK